MVRGGRVRQVSIIKRNGIVSIYIGGRRRYVKARWRAAATRSREGEERVFHVATTMKSRAAERGVGRAGRPSRDHAGEVEERILDAAQSVFLERGLEGASVDEIAEAAHAGKPTIYARYPHKQALFAAVMERMVRRRTEIMAAGRLSAETGSTVEERLTIFATLILQTALVDETIDLVRAAIAEARRFPNLASSVHRLVRERGANEIAGLLGELAESGDAAHIPALAPDRLPEAAQRFAELVIQPIVMRALFGEDLAALRTEIAPRVKHAVDFFLAACGLGGDARP
jgi:AcrR family transcriptional regulator